MGINVLYLFSWCETLNVIEIQHTPLIFTNDSFRSKKLTEEQILQDYVVLKNVLTKGHPNLYEYTSKSKWGSLFVNFEENKIKTIDNKNDLYKSIIELTDYVRDGHLIVMRTQIDSLPNFFSYY